MFQTATITTSHKQTSNLDDLPHSPSPEVSEKYMFIDTRKVIDDMRDLGFEVADFARPKTRTASGRYGLHQVDFRRPQDMNLNGAEAPRILFVNSYDGSKRATFIAGLIRFACSNGLVIGDILETHKFLHLGNYADELMAALKELGKSSHQAFDRIETYRKTPMDVDAAYEFAQKAAELRWEDEKIRPDVDPRNLLQVRRNGDLGTDLWTKFNVVQENLIKGGVPLVNKKGQARLAPPVQNIERSNNLNRQLWNLADSYAEPMKVEG
jgi:hypothetical protein